MITLKKKRILVTRDVKGADLFAKKITEYDGEAVILPLLKINCLPVKNATSLSIENENFDWVFFTSKNGVDCFLQSAQFESSLKHCRIAAVGPKTAQAVEEYGYHVDFVPSVYNARVMAAEFLEKYKETGSVLFVRGTLSRKDLPEAFARAERPFRCLEVYETAVNFDMQDRLQTILMEEKIDLLTFTSPSAIDAFIDLAENLDHSLEIPVVCIGTTTEKRAKEIGFKKTLVPKHFTIEGMIEVMSKYLK